MYVSHYYFCVNLNLSRRPKPSTKPETVEVIIPVRYLSCLLNRTGEPRIANLFQKYWACSNIDAVLPYDYSLVFAAPIYD